MAPAQPHDRVFNFSAGPGALPVPVLEEAARDALNYKGCGISVMELSHRSKEFTEIIEDAEADLRKLLEIPDNYRVLFLQGGASAQFAAIPLNLTASKETVVDYLVTGSWSKKAAEEAGKYATVNVVAKGDNKSIPDAGTWKVSPEAAYLHYCDNETIQGVEFLGEEISILLLLLFFFLFFFSPSGAGRGATPHRREEKRENLTPSNPSLPHPPPIPTSQTKHAGVPEVPEGTLLVADMSSNFCSKKVDVSRYGLIYAGAQKNIGPAGVTVVIVRDDLVGKARPETPAIFDYKVMEGSLYNTPPCWSIYICGLVFKHMLAAGGIDAVAAANAAKAAALYDAIDSSAGGFFVAPVDRSCRSRMNVPFVVPSKGEEAEKLFVAEAAKAGMKELKGHRSVGGMRASIYNSVPREGVDALIAFMKEFAEKNA